MTSWKSCWHSVESGAADPLPKCSLLEVKRYVDVPRLLRWSVRDTIELSRSKVGSEYDLIETHNHPECESNNSRNRVRLSTSSINSFMHEVNHSFSRFERVHFCLTLYLLFKIHRPRAFCPLKPHYLRYPFYPVRYCITRLLCSLYCSSYEQSC